MATGTYLREVLSDWNQNETVTLIAVDGSTNPQYCQPVAGRVEVCDWWYGTQTGWLGLSRIYFNARGDHIDAATVQLNNSFLYAPNGPYNNDAARRHTLCHELGHTLGLDHPETTSCMNNSQHAVFNYVTRLTTTSGTCVGSTSIRMRRGQSRKRPRPTSVCLPRRLRRS